MNFPCTQCGACCRNVGNFPQLPQDKNGKCAHLKSDNTCAIYGTRPKICSIEEVGKALNISDWSDWVEVNKTACNNLMDEMDIPESYRIA